MPYEDIEVLTFDCYGTLIDWESGILGALSPWARRHGLNISDERLLELYGELEAKAEADGSRYRDVLARVMRDLHDLHGIPASRVAPDDESLLAVSLPSWPPFPDTVAALRLLAARYRLGILSNIDDDLFEGSARQLGVPFDWVVTAQQVGSYKPSEGNFHALLERVGGDSRRILHVAQSLYHDIGPARAVGLRTVWVNRRGAKPGSGATPASSARPDAEVGSLAELVEHLGL